LDLVTVIGLAFALAMDAFAVAAGVGTSLTKATRRQYFRLSWHFGLFQFLMPVLGWILGSLAVGIVGSAGRWIAFAILCLLGAKMIREAGEGTGRRGDPSVDPTRGWSLVLLSIATSIDAFAAGLALAMLGAGVLAASAVIGLVASLMTIAGMRLGSFVGARLGRGAEVLGGLVLIGLGIGILAEILAV